MKSPSCLLCSVLPDEKSPLFCSVVWCLSNLMKNTTCFALFCSVVPHDWPEMFLLLVICSAL